MTQALLIEQLDHDILRMIIFQKDDDGNRLVLDIFESSSHPWMRKQLKWRHPECQSIYVAGAADFIKVWDKSKVFQTAFNLRLDLRTPEDEDA